MRISVVEIKDFLPNWIGVSLEDMSSFFRFCIDNSCRDLSDKEYVEWAHRIGYITPERDKTYRLRTVFPTCKSIYENGFDYKCLPNVMDQYNISSGRHRISVMHALGVDTTPVLHVNTTGDHYVSQELLDRFFESPEGVLFKSSRSWELLSVR